MSLETGVAAWHARRKAWTASATEPPPPNELSAMLERIQDNSQMVQIYKQLVVGRKHCVRPIPLSFAVKVIVAGWKEDGTWPEGMDPPPASDTEEE